MLFSLSLVLIVGLLFSGLFKKVGLPGLLGMILTGILLGPSCLNLLKPDLLSISADLREFALLVILLRAGLSLDLSDLKKVGRPAMLLCFIPATFELLAITIIAPILFNITYIEAAIMGAVLSAVSPAVVVPRMIHLMDSGYGREKKIPQLIMAGASVDDIYVIVLFTMFMGMYEGGSFNMLILVKVPIAIFLGLVLGFATGMILTKIFKVHHYRDTVKILIVISICILFVTLETALKTILPISGLLSVMALGISILEGNESLAKRLLSRFDNLWVGSEIILFVLVGAAVNINYIPKAGILSVVLILSALIFRMIGVNISLTKTPLNIKERLFCSIAYLPKATVQAAIGALPLAAGVSSGEIILTVAVVAIIITSPIGAIGIDRMYKKLL